MKNTKEREAVFLELRALYICIHMTPENFTTFFGAYVNHLSTLSSKRFKKILKKIDRSGSLNKSIMGARIQITSFVMNFNSLKEGYEPSPLTFDGTQFKKLIIYPNSFNSMVYPDIFEFMKNRDDGGPSHFLKNTNDIIKKVLSFWTEERLNTLLNHIV